MISNLLVSLLIGLVCMPWALGNAEPEAIPQPEALAGTG